jgi:hypothetical protein
MLLLVGIELWFLVMHGIGIREHQPLIIAAAAILAMIRPSARGFERAFDAIAHPSLRTRSIITVVVFLASIAILYSQAFLQQRDFQLRYQDEYSYRIQTLMVAHGRLWEPGHPLPEFFESFQLIATPVYASVYFPGAAILYAPGVWLRLPHWVIPLIASAAVVALVYWIFTELIDGLAALLGALLVISNPIFREQSIMVMAQVPAMLGAMALIWAYLHWRENKSLRWALVMAIIAGWLAITRPVDALIAIIPVGVAVITNLWSVSWSRRARTVLAGFAGVLPFLALQVVFNLRVTGRLTETPFDFYTRQVYPQATYGFHGDDLSVHPAWPLPQVQEAYESLQTGLLRDHTPRGELVRWATQYVPDTIHNILPHSLLIILMPMGLLGLGGRRWLLAGMLPLFVALYFPYVYFIRHYSTVVIPAGMMLVALGIRVTSDLSPHARPQILTFLVVSIAALVVSEWAGFNRLARDEFMPAESLRAIDRALASLPHRPAIVLFRYTSGGYGDEPEYNPEVLYPDDAPIIRAHDLGDRDVALFRYYAERHPDRWVYLYDRGSGTIRELGPVRALAESSP